MGFSGLIFIWVSQTRINTANFFMAIVNLESILQRLTSIHIPKIVTAIFVGIIVYVVMLADVFSFIYQALSYLAIMVVAWVSIAVTHILSPLYEKLMGPTLELREHYVPAINPAGLLAWFLAAFVGLLFFNAGGQWVASSSPATAIVASVVYLLMLKRAKRSWYVRDALAKEQES